MNLSMPGCLLYLACLVYGVSGPHLRSEVEPEAFAMVARLSHPTGSATQYRPPGVLFSPTLVLLKPHLNLGAFQSSVWGLSAGQGRGRGSAGTCRLRLHAPPRAGLVFSDFPRAATVLAIQDGRVGESEREREMEF